MYIFSVILLLSYGYLASAQWLPTYAYTIKKVGDASYEFQTHGSTISMSHTSSPQAKPLQETVISQRNLPNFMTKRNDTEFESVNLHVTPSGKFEIFFGTRLGCIGVATASVFSGPYNVSETPILCAEDASSKYRLPTVVSHKEQLILYYNNVDKQSSRIEARNMTKDGLSVTSENAAVVLLAVDVEGGDVHTPFDEARASVDKDVFYIFRRARKDTGIAVVRSTDPFGKFVEFDEDN